MIPLRARTFPVELLLSCVLPLCFAFVRALSHVDEGRWPLLCLLSLSSAGPTPYKSGDNQILIHCVRFRWMQLWIEFGAQLLLPPHTLTYAPPRGTQEYFPSSCLDHTPLYLRCRSGQTLESAPVSATKTISMPQLLVFL